MPTERRCEKCGAALAPFGAEDLCPKCMLSEAVGLATDPSARAQAAVAAATPVTEKPGDRIGRYKLLQQIGEGGMGVVYMAEQEEPVRRRVAVKVIKLGMDTKSVIARFEAERQALALMDHPNIAKVLDAGATETPLPASGHPLPSPDEGRGQGEGSLVSGPALNAGRPYFVMELVRGIRITDYCDQNHLSTQQRLDLFAQICKAIQHAHQKGIIHRDIKPSNILVTLHDGVPVPKIIDFGIAKATSDQRLTDKTLFTAFEQFIGTPAYMSPEQAELSGLDIDTRSDIYSLGVLLYELLTGQTPFEAKELLAAGLDAMRRTIREKEPPKPSTRLSAMGMADTVDVTNRFQMSPMKLAAFVRGDLDWIVMKALEKDRARRYDTANDLVMDIQRHVHNEPVVACPPSNLYRFQKLVRRNKVAFAATSAVAAALIIGLGLSAWLFLREKAARQRAVAAEQKAKTEAGKSQQVAGFLKDMLNGVGPSVALGRDTTMLREVLDKTTERVGKDLKDEPDVEGELRHTIGEVYGALGQYEKAQAIVREALALRRKLFGNEHPKVAESLNSVAGMLLEQGELAEAEAMVREALAMRRKLLGNEHPAVAESLNTLATALQRQSKLAEAETINREAVAMFKKTLGHEHTDVARSLYNLAITLERQGKLAEAETMHRETLAMQRKLFGNEHPDVARTLGSLASVLQFEGKLAEAETMNREELVMFKKLLGNEHPTAVQSLRNLVYMLGRQGKLAEAETLLREALSMQRNTENVHALNSLAWLLATCVDSAIRDGRSAVSFAEKAVAATNRREPVFLDTLAAAYAEVGQFANAVSVQKEAIAVLQDGKSKKGWKKGFEARLNLYKSNSPFRESWGAESPSNQTQGPTKPAK